MRHFEGGEVEAGCDGATDERPLTKRSGGLPPAGGNDLLRPFSAEQVGTEPGLRSGPAGLGNAELERGAGVVVPDLGGIVDPVPMRPVAAFEKVVDGRRVATRATIGIAERLPVPTAFRMPGKTQRFK